MTPRLREKYKNEIIKNLMTKLSLNNIQAVPEFGTIAALILVVAISSIIALSAKSRLSFMPRI